MTERVVISLEEYGSMHKNDVAGHIDTWDESMPGASEVQKAIADGIVREDERGFLHLNKSKEG